MTQSAKGDNPENRAAPRPLRWIRDGWLMLGVVIILLLLVDAVLKATLPEPWALETVNPGVQAPDRRSSSAMGDAAWASDYFSELKAARKTRWQPWSYWRREAFSGRMINVDDQGIRKSWQPPQPRYEVWMLGGSTVWGTGARDDHTLPSALARALYEAGLAARVVNLGESGYVSGQDQARLLRRLEQMPAPDAVLFYGGANDVFAALQAGTAGLSQNEQHRAADFRVTDGLDNWLAAAPAVLEGIGRLRARLLPVPHQQTRPEDLAAAVARHYAHRMEATQAVLSAHQVPQLVFWQPTVFSRATPRGDESRIVGASLAQHRDLQLASDRAVRERMAGNPGFHDLSGILDEQSRPYFLDFCHLSEAGNAVIAAHMAELLGPVLDQATSD